MNNCAKRKSLTKSNNIYTTAIINTFNTRVIMLTNNLKIRILEYMADGVVYSSIEL